MVVGADGGNLGVMPTDIALKRAEEAGLDLVEVAPEARPPVCKILDFGKFKYIQKKKQADAKRNQNVQDLKEVKLRPKTDDHDYDFKLKHCKRFLEDGDKVKVTIMFRGREVIHKDIAIKRLDCIAKDLSDIAKVETHAKMEGRTMHMIIAPKVGLAASVKKKSEASATDKKPKKEAGKKSENESSGGELRTKLDLSKIAEAETDKKVADPDPEAEPKVEASAASATSEEAKKTAVPSAGQVATKEAEPAT